MAKEARADIPWIPPLVIYIGGGHGKEAELSSRGVAGASESSVTGRLSAISDNSKSRYVKYKI